MREIPHDAEGNAAGSRRFSRSNIEGNTTDNQVALSVLSERTRVSMKVIAGYSWTAVVS